MSDPNQIPAGAFNLPPGCTPNDIDPPVYCASCGIAIRGTVWTENGTFQTFCEDCFDAQFHGDEAQS